MQTALVALDSKQLALIVSKMLGDFGFDALYADSFEQIQKNISEKHPAVLFVDWMLNGQPIEDILQRLADKPIIIFISSEKSPPKMQLALDLGATEYIMKPFDNDILQSKLAIAGLL